MCLSCQRTVEGCPGGRGKSRRTLDYAKNLSEKNERRYHKGSDTAHQELRAAMMRYVCNEVSLARLIIKIVDGVSWKERAGLTGAG